MSKHLPLRLLAFLTLTAAPAFAQPVVNGTIAGDSYGAAAAVQAVQTGFPDNSGELDAAYCTVTNGRLYLALTGNIGIDLHQLEIFIDSKAGGENTLGGLPGTESTSAMTGLTFDPGFTADYLIFVRRSGSQFNLSILELGTANTSVYTDIFGGGTQGVGATGTGLNALPIQIAYDHSNVAGVTGGTGAANQAAALAVQTGVELSIALSDLGHAGQDIKVCSFLNAINHNFASNQFLGPVPPPQVNLGGDGNGTFTGAITFNLGNFPGDQFFTCHSGAVDVQNSTWGRLKTLYR